MTARTCPRLPPVASARRGTITVCSASGNGPVVSRRQLGAATLFLGGSSLVPPPVSADDTPVGGGSGGGLALVTGCNTGIGLEVVRGLASRGYEVVLGCRTVDKGRAAAAVIAAGVPGAKLRVLDVPLELGDLRSVAAYADAVRRLDTPLSLLVNNAGIMAAPYMTTAQGHESHIGVNHLGHFALSNALLEPLRAGRARVVNVSSVAAYGDSLRLDDLDWRQRKYDPWMGYFASKLANVLFTRSLAAREPLLVTHAVHPGVVNTDLARYILPADWQDGKAKDPERSAAVARLLGLRSPTEGAAPVLWVALDAAAGKDSGRFFLDAAQEAPALFRPGGGSDGMLRAEGLWQRSQEMMLAA